LTLRPDSGGCPAGRIAVFRSISIIKLTLPVDVNGLKAREAPGRESPGGSTRPGEPDRENLTGRDWSGGSPAGKHAGWQ
jgi:hypothetical protein